MDRFKARPLRTLSLASRPLSPHALAWSCDAELAVATAERIYIFLPEYSIGAEANNSPDTSQQQFTLSLQPSAIVPPNHGINVQLCAQAGVKIPQEEKSFGGVGESAIGGRGSALGQVVRLEWSPNGLGCNLRPVLLGLTTSGSVVAFGEHVDRRVAGTASMRTRSFKNWKMLWGLGAGLPLPDEHEEEGFRHMDERITSFSWAEEVDTGRALLAYANDGGEVVVMSVEHFSPGSAAAPEDESVWKLVELGRFDARGPHDDIGPSDPDFVPHGSIFSLKWSPWLVRDGYRSATLAYIARGHVGFRRITIYNDWRRGEKANFVMEDGDTTGVCLFLSSDAFIEWEDAIWPEGDAFIARGVIATPFVVKPFQIALNGVLDKPIQQHSPFECSSAYPKGETSTNPITGLVTHRPDPHNKPETPFYSAVRLSATPTNVDWYQTNVPEHIAPLPQWAEDLADQTSRLVSRGAALQGVDSDLDSDDDEDEDYDELESDNDEAQLQVHPYRFRLWGLAQSPGGGCLALLASKHSTQHPSRRGSCAVHFDWLAPAEDVAQPRHPPALTTEGKMWEWMYGMGEDVVGATTATAPREKALRTRFHSAAAQVLCAFCGCKFRTIGDDQAMCENGHSFATCAASGVPIIAPGISRICGVCKLPCLKVSELQKLAETYLLSTDETPSGQVCGGCGGKFIV